MNKPEQTKTVDVTWVLVAAALLLAGVVGYSIRVMMVEERAVEQQQAEREAAQQRRLQHLVDGIEEGPAEMLIDFGDIQLNCAKQNLLSYTEYDPDGFMTVANNSVSYNSAGYPEMDGVYLRKPIADVTTNVFSEIGMQFNVLSEDASFFIVADWGTGFSGAEGQPLWLPFRPYADPDGGHRLVYKGAHAGTFQMAAGVEYTVQLCRYLDDDVYHAVARVFIGEALQATMETTDGDASDMLGYSQVYVYPIWNNFPLSVADPVTVTVSNVYVSGASPVLPQIRNTPNLGHLLIRPGGNT